MTLVLLALDALDAGLVEHFDLEAYRLTSSGELGTYAHSKDRPFTPEVWATAATGLGPEDHGVTGAGTSEWDNPVLELASRFTAHLSERQRGRLGRVVRSRTNTRERVGRTQVESVFDRPGAVVRNWPGVTDGRDLQRAWELVHAVRSEVTRSEFERDLLGMTAEQFAWAREMLGHDVSLAGVHVHALDAAGHAYCRDEAALEHVYRRVAGFVEDLVAAMDVGDDLLLLSDHGMNVEFYEVDPDSNPGNHSWRAYASATTDDLPETVYDVVDWVDRHFEEPSREDRERYADVPVEQLRELGYIE